MLSRPPVPRRSGAAFVLPLVAILWAGEVGQDEPVTGANLLAVATVCGAAGVAWQLLHRRDLVDRMTHFAAIFTVIAIFSAVAAWDGPVSSSIGAGIGLGAVLTGLVYTEQWLRSRDRRRASSQPTVPHQAPAS